MPFDPFEWLCFRCLLHFESSKYRWPNAQSKKRQLKLIAWFLCSMVLGLEFLWKFKNHSLESFNFSQKPVDTTTNLIFDHSETNQSRSPWIECMRLFIRNMLFNVYYIYMYCINGIAHFFLSLLWSSAAIAKWPLYILRSNWYKDLERAISLCFRLIVNKWKYCETNWMVTLA